MTYTWTHNSTTGTLNLGDCLEGIKTIPDKSIKSIITDPPYFLGLTHNGQKGVFSDLIIASTFYRQLFAEFDRILTDDGCLYFFCDWRSYAFYYPLIDEVLDIKNMLVWDKGSGVGNFYTFEHELTIFCTKNKRFRGKGCRNIIRDIKGFSFASRKATEGNKLHPTQKPVELITKYILDSTEPHDTVLDCFAGSSTTAISCIDTGRNCILYEVANKFLI